MKVFHNIKVACQRIRLKGVVQGVGLRPLVLRLAKELKLTGWVRNDAHGVEIEVCGESESIEHLTRRLQQDAPPLARIDAITTRDAEAPTVTDDFFILDSRGGRSATMIGQDTAVCRNCLGEMFDADGRRWRYAFTNCAHCGPRYTICRGLPYDRARTSMKAFAMCKKCLKEYARPEDSRLHAEANCCPKCGPQLALLDALGRGLDGDPIEDTLRLLQDGRIVAIKGPGGFHLVCDARNADAVARLRERKGRPNKPFAVMVANALSATTHVQVSVGEPGLLNLPERPIILLRKRSSCDKTLAGVAPDLHWLGVMLPFSPIHYLLFHEAAGRPQGTEWLDTTQPLTLAMTSANPGREPPAIDNDEALRRLAGMADAYLVHNRDIVTGCDDSIACTGLGGLQIIRRARGYAPHSVKLMHSGLPLLAVGGSVRNTICVTRGAEAFVSQHIGELSNPAANAFFEETVAHLLKILEVSPVLVAHDLRPDTPSAAFAAAFARQRGIPLLGVQHHHAHIAAILAEHHVTAPVVALALDGGELGLDGTVWGGELLRVDGAQFERLGQMAPLKLVGDDQTSRAPWRLAAALLHELGRNHEIAGRFATQADADVVARQLADNIDCRQASSMGRVFDAVSALLGIKLVATYSGQAGLLLEGLADRHGHAEVLKGGWSLKDGHLDLMPLFAHLADEKNAGRGAAVFHATLIEALAEWLLTSAPSGSTVAAGGGCMQNQVLSRGLRARLADSGLHLIEARRVPPNDGGISLGQAWIAHHHLERSLLNK